MKIIAGTYKGRHLKTTTGPGFRPAMGKVREALFSMLEAHGIIWPQTSMLDLFAGSGSIGFEALSRGAASVTFVDSAPYAAKIIATNASLLDIPTSRYTILQADVMKLTSRHLPTGYGLICIDPPYRDIVLSRVIQKLMQHNWLAPGTIVNAEVESRQKFAAETLHDQLSLIADRAYGQTRVLLWEVKTP